MRKYDPEKYKLNREAQLAAAKRYYQKNREARLAKQKQYDDSHREQIVKRFKEKNNYRTKIET